jgi:pyruvate dehydrogenase E1 component beta subunit
MAGEEGVEAQVVDLLTLSPLDMAPVVESVRRTGRAVVVHEAHRSYGPGAEIVSRIVEEAFWHLEAPVRRVTAPDVHVPFFARENEYLPTEDRIRASFRAVLEA